MKTRNLYHYTSRHQAELIIKSGYLKLTPSNLIKPTDLKKVRNEDGTYDFVSAISDPVKPVVWMTDSLDSSGHGLEHYNAKGVKQRVRITIPMKESYKWWVTWAERNRMNKKWFKDFTRNHRYGTWYVSENPITLEDVLLIEDLETADVLYENYQLDVLTA